jgi:hypothetical protein
MGLFAGTLFPLQSTSETSARMSMGFFADNMQLATLAFFLSLHA